MVDNSTVVDKGKQIPTVTLLTAYLIVLSVSIGLSSLIGTLFASGIVLATLKVVGTVCGVTFIGLMINGIVADALASK